MIEPILKSQLEPVARRHRRWRLWRGLAFCWVAAAVAGLGLIGLQRAAGWGGRFLMPLLGGAALAAATATWWRIRKWEPDFRQIARRIEQHHPELHALLLTAVEQQADARTGQLNYLQQRVIREAVIEGLKHSWLDTVSNARLWLMQGAQWATLLLFAAVLMGLRVSETKATIARLTKAGVTITPGDATIERGSSLVVLARFAGPLPANVNLVVGQTPETSRTIPLIKTLSDPVFGGSIPEVAADFAYHIEYAGQRSRDFKVTVFEYPRLERADADVTFPDYTGLSPKRIEDTRRVSAVEGSLLDLSLQLNKPVATARLVARDKSVVPLAVRTNKASVALDKFALTASKTYELQLVDAEGRTNKVPAQFFIEALKNRAPELKLATPRGDQRVSPLEEISFQAEAWDDFGLRAYGLSYTVAGGETKTVTLGEAVPAGEKRHFNHLLKLEELSVQPDQLLSWFVWADDVGPDGKVRRTASDMYFAEVRPFEEIFREGQSPDGQSGQQQPRGNQATKLAELQKQIINATWKLQRQEGGKEPTPQYKKDAGVVQQSQEHALEQARMLKARALNPRAEILIEGVEKEMEQALDRLTAATNSPAPLPDALKAEQAAYQALLKLSAHEYQVTQSRNRNGGGGGGERQQRQLDQLELKQAENRYETQRQASPLQNAEQREQLQVLNRLKELAQRQQDLNERLKELQTALQEARTEQEREEIRRQLKRLRDEERELLADVDELRQRMERPENQSRMAEARQQLEKTRDEVQRAAEALENSAVPQALTSGTRAQRDLQQLRDDFRKKNSSQFADEMRQMRNEARELAQKQEDVGKKIESLTDGKRRTLSDSDERKDLEQQLAQQSTGLTNLLSDMRRVSEAAEGAEPLLSQKLYDTLRQHNQDDAKNKQEVTNELLQRGVMTRSLYDLLRNEGGQGPNNSLEVTTEMVRRGNVAEAGQLEQRTRRSLCELKRGVERAAESVLGDDTEALRFAKRELDDLTQQLEKEIAQADPKAEQAGGVTSRQGAPGQGTNAASRANASAPPGGQTNLLASAQGTNQQAGASQQGTQRNQSAQASRDRGSDNQPGSQGQGQQGQQSQSAQDSQGQNQQGQGARGQSSQGQAQQGQGSEGQNAQANAQSQGSGQQSGGDPSSRQEQARGTGRGGENVLRNFFNRGGSEDGGGGGGGGPHGPITGPEHTDWSDRLRDVEEMIDMPELRNEVARVRERVRATRAELKRHSKEPQWPLVKAQIATPLTEVRNRLGEELARRESKDALVPIDRDPVPSKFSELVRRYYEKLGKE